MQHYILVLLQVRFQNNQQAKFNRINEKTNFEEIDLLVRIQLNQDLFGMILIVDH